MWRAHTHTHAHTNTDARIRAHTHAHAHTHSRTHGTRSPHTPCRLLKKALQEEYDISSASLGLLDTLFLLPYALGSLTLAPLGDAYVCAVLPYG